MWTHDVPQTEKHYLFVYGTLKRGHCNHYLLEGCPFMGEAETKEKYALYEADIPYVIKEKKISHIKGEVYEVPRHILKRIDRLEGHPFFYKREKARVVLEDGREVEAWMYFWICEINYARLNKNGTYGG